MPSGIEVTKQALDDFRKIQKYMLLAKEENATKTYAELKEEYLTLKALLNVSGVNMTDIDRSQYIFCTIAQNIPLLESGSIRFFDRADEEILKDYLCD